MEFKGDIDDVMINRCDFFALLTMKYDIKWLNLLFMIRVVRSIILIYTPKKHIFVC